jgi:hypothetical protein
MHAHLATVFAHEVLSALPFKGRYFIMKVKRALGCVLSVFFGVTPRRSNIVDASCIFNCATSLLLK